MFDFTEEALNQTAKQAHLIRMLNPILRGWANYHSHVVAKQTFARNDNAIWSMLWQWAPGGIPIRAPDGLKRNTLKPEGPETGPLPPLKKKRVRKESGFCSRSRTPPYGGIPRLKRMPTRMILNGRSISNPGGVKKC